MGDGDAEAGEDEILRACFRVGDIFKKAVTVVNKKFYFFSSD